MIFTFICVFILCGLLGLLTDRTKEKYYDNVRASFVKEYSFCICSKCKNKTFVHYDRLTTFLTNDIRLCKECYNKLEDVK